MATWQAITGRAGSQLESGPRAADALGHPIRDDGRSPIFEMGDVGVNGVRTIREHVLEAHDGSPFLLKLGREPQHAVIALSPEAHHVLLMAQVLALRVSQTLPPLGNGMNDEHDLERLGPT